MASIQPFGTMRAPVTATIPDTQRKAIAAEPANIGDTVSISQAAREAYAAYAASEAPAAASRDRSGLAAKTSSLAQALTAEVGSIAIWT